MPCGLIWIMLHITRNWHRDSDRRGGRGDSIPRNHCETTASARWLACQCLLMSQVKLGYLLLRTRPRMLKNQRPEQHNFSPIEHALSLSATRVESDDGAAAGT